MFSECFSLNVTPNEPMVPIRAVMAGKCELTLTFGLMWLHIRHVVLHYVYEVYRSELACGKQSPGYGRLP